MIRRSPTRIELKLDDLQEFDYIQKYSEKNKKSSTNQTGIADPKAIRAERIGYRTPHHHRSSGNTTVAVPVSSAAAVVAATVPTTTAVTTASTNGNNNGDGAGGSSSSSTASTTTATGVEVAQDSTNSSTTPPIDQRGTGNVFRQLSFSSATSPNNLSSQANINNMSIDSEFSD